MVTFENTIALIESTIKSFGVDPNTCKGEQAGQYDLKRGSASVWLDVWTIDGQNDTKNYYVQVIAPILDLSTVQNQLGLFQELLELNHQLYGVGFSVYKTWVYLRVIREADGLDSNELSAMLNRVGTYADDYDDQLKQKYCTTTPPPPNTGWATPGEKPPVS